MTLTLPFSASLFFNRAGFRQRNHTGYISYTVSPLLCFLFPKAWQWSPSKPGLQVYHLSYSTFEQRPKMLSNFAFLSLFKFHLIGWGYGSLRVCAALSGVWRFPALKSGSLNHWNSSFKGSHGLLQPPEEPEQKYEIFISFTYFFFIHRFLREGLTE